MTSLRHANIATFVGACPTAPHVCVVWELCARGNLDDVISGSDIRPVCQTLRISLAVDVCDGLAYLHRCQVGVHGRLKSGNVWIDHRWTAKLADFGLRRFRKREKKPKKIKVEDAGFYRNLFWCSPEIVRTVVTHANAHKSFDCRKMAADIPDDTSRTSIEAYDASPSSIGADSGNEHFAASISVSKFHPGPNGYGTNYVSNGTSDQALSLFSYIKLGNVRNFICGSNLVTKGSHITHLQSVSSKSDPKPSKTSDIYSLAIVLKQILCINSAYARELKLYSAKEIVHKIAATSEMQPFRPQITEEFSDQQTVMSALAQLIKRCWAEDPMKRPTAKRVLRSMKKLRKLSLLK